MTWLRSRLFRKPDSGQGTIEYLGVAVLISVLIASLAVAPVAPKLGTAIKDTVCKIAQPVLGGSCNSSQEKEPTPEGYMVECPVVTQTNRHGSKVEVLYFSLGSGVTMKVTEMSDGTAEVQLIGDVNAGASLEAAKAKFDGWVKLNAGIGIDITGSMGDTWSFDNVEDAKSFAQANQDRVDSWTNNIPVLGTAINTSNAPENPRKSTYAVDLSALGEVSGGVDISNAKDKFKDGKNKNSSGDKSGNSSDDGGKGDKSGSSSDDGGKGDKSGDDWKTNGYDSSGKSDPKELSNLANLSKLDKYIPEGSVGVDGSKTGSFQIDRGENLDDPSDDKMTFAFDLKESGNASGKGLGFDGGANVSGQTSFVVEADVNGNVTGLKIAQSVEGGAGTGGAKDDNKSKVFVADFDLSDPESRKTVTDFLQNPGGIPNLEDLAQGKLIGSTPEQKAMAEYMQSPNVKLNEMTMKNTNESDGFSLGAKLFGVGLGYENSNSSSTAELEDAYTWVPDGNGGRKRVKNTKCS